MFVRDSDGLVRWAAEPAPSFRLAEPFPHSVIDGLFDDATLSRALDAFPGIDAVPWYDNELERKPATPHADALAPGLREVFRALRSPEFVRFVETLTGIDDLSSDDELVGAGLHQIEAGGSVAVHADSNYQPSTMLDRRVNALVFLNKDWPEEHGGHLELWDAR